MPDKPAERFYLETFLATMPYLADATIEPGESPDFIVSSPSGRIGIELKRHAPDHRPGTPHPKEQDSLQERTMAAAKELWYSYQPIALDLTAQFLAHPPLTKARVRPLAAEIVHCLASRVSRLEVFHWAIFKAGADSEAPSEIHSLRALRVPDRSYGVWQAGQGGWVSRAGEDVIRTLVASKEPKVAAYRSRVDEVWLLITLQHMDAGDVVEGPDTPVGFQISTTFDRVFSFDIFSRRVVEIPLERAA